MKPFVALIALAGGILVFIPSFTRMNDIRQRNRDYERQINELTAKNRELKEELRLLRDDPEYLEKVAREKMGLVRDGEVIYKIMPAADGADSGLND
jgi:cell division protein FtsB